MDAGLLRPLLALSLSSLVAAGCSDRPAAEDDCPSRPSPAFALTVRTESGAPLPADAHIRVSASGGAEEFDAASPLASPEIAFCSVDGDGGVTTLSCKLWTSGAAEVTVTAGGYEPIERRKLVAETDPCGIKTVDVKIALRPLAAE